MPDIWYVIKVQALSERASKVLTIEAGSDGSLYGLQ